MSEHKVHELKCWPEHFQAIIDGTKTAEVRINDRDYRIGDVLALQEWDPKKRTYTGRDIFKIVTHIISGWNFVGISPGYVCMSIKEPE